jgi:hypothetical protein
MGTDSADNPAPTLTITGHMAIDALRHVVHQHGPDHLYQSPDPSLESCVYAWKNPETGDLEPRCIVAWALHHLGVPLDVLYDAGNFVNIIGLVPELERRGYHLTDEAVLILKAAQLVQDNVVGVPLTEELKAESTWGKALHAAEKVAARDHLNP